MTDARSLIMGASTPGFSFLRINDTVTGQIITEPKAVQQRNFHDGQPAFWPSGDPKMQTVFQVQTSFRNYEGISNPDRSKADDGVRSLFVKGKHMEKATKDAILAAGASWLDVGGFVQFTYIGDDMESRAASKPKFFAVRYQPPAAQAQQGYASPTQQYAQQGFGANGMAGQGYPAQQPPRPPQQAQPTPDWQRPGWTPADARAQGGPVHAAQPTWVPPGSPAEMIVPSHHGQPDAMPDWASPAPQSAPPVQPTSAPPAPALSTLDLIRANAVNVNMGGQTGSSDPGSVQPVF